MMSPNAPPGFKKQQMKEMQNKHKVKRRTVNATQVKLTFRKMFLVNLTFYLICHFKVHKINYINVTFNTILKYEMQ